MSKIEADWLQSEGVKRVIAAFGGKQIYFVGGCVRNTLLGAPITDIDLATPLTPEQVTKHAEVAGLKSVPTGIEHGTVTLVAGSEHFEVTTFRQDVETDGRHAKVKFSQHLDDDAARRDFTMNALYADPAGKLIDPVDGLRDLKAGKLRFIGEPAARITEDYLRILRFFRFHAWYANQEAGIDQEGLAACAEHAAGLDNVARERVGAEFIKLLTAPNPYPVIASMAQTGVLQHIVPHAGLDSFLVLAETEVVASPIARLALLAMGKKPVDLRLSKKQAWLLDYLQEQMAATVPLEEISYRENAKVARMVAGLRAAIFEQPIAQIDLGKIDHAAGQKMPVVAHDLMPRYTGKELGDALAALERQWISSGFTKKKDELLAGLET